MKLTLRIDWSELDYFEHVNNVSFFKYIQSARVNYWDKIGLTQLHLDTKAGPMLASAHCDFKKPLFYPGEVTIHTELDFIKNTSFGFKHTLYNQSNECVAEAHDVMVMFDFKTQQKMAIPDSLRSALIKVSE